MVINFNNVEEIIFYNSKIHKKLPEYKNIFNQWKLSKTSPSLKAIGKRAILDFMNEADVELLESVFGQKVKVEKINYHLVNSFESTVDNLCCDLEQSLSEGFVDILLYRNKDNIYVSTWR